MDGLAGNLLDRPAPSGMDSCNGFDIRRIEQDGYTVGRCDSHTDVWERGDECVCSVYVLLLCLCGKAEKGILDDSDSRSVYLMRH